MNSLVIIANFPFNKSGGVGTYVLGRTQELLMNSTVTVLGRGDSCVCDGINYVSLGPVSNNVKSFFNNWFNLMKIVKRGQWNHIEIHNIPMALPIILCSFNYHYFFHGPADAEAKVEGKSRFKIFIARALDRFTLNRASRVSVVSLYFYNYLLKRYSTLENRLSIIEPKFILSKHQKDEKLISSMIKPDRTNVVIVRRLVERTGVYNFLKFFLDIDHPNKNDFHFHICGLGPQLNLIKNLQSENPHLLTVYGRVTEIKKQSLYAGCNFNLVPSVALEGFGLVLVEGALQGCPSVVSNIGAMPDIIKSFKYFGSTYDQSVEGFYESAKVVCGFSQKNRRELKEFAKRKYLIDKS